MSVRVRCTNPDCGQPYQVPDEQLGHTVVCQKCQRSFILGAVSKETAAPAAQSDTGKPAPPPIRRTLVEPSQSPPIRRTLAEPPKPPSQPSAAALGKKESVAREAGVPEKIGRFEVEKRLGAGAFGQVYRARDPLLDREIALKVPHASTLQSETHRARVLTEAKAAAQLRHPNIVPVYEAGRDGDTYYIASAFIEGQTLEDAIDQQRPDFRQAAKLVMDLAGALDYAHELGVVHRDVKPANIMLDRKGNPLLMDFGLARLETAESNLTHDGTVLGTPSYMPPEQAAGRLELVGPASDQYSLGVVLYELLCGSTPFSGPPAMVISLVIHQEPPSPRVENAAVPKDLETICLKAMSKKRDHRYAGCQAMAEDLRRWLAGEPITARRVSPVERLYRWCRRNPVVAGLTAAAALLVVLVAVVASVGYVTTSHARNRAESALAGETVARREAENEASRAEKEKSRAESALAGETAARREAERERLRAEKQLLRAEWLLYAGNIRSAQREWETDHVWLAWHYLDLCRADFRGWEHDYLRTLFSKNQRTLNTVTVRSLAFSPRGKRIATGHQGGTLKVWDVATGVELLTLKGNPGDGDVDGVAFSPDGRRIASASNETV